jgi:hypothetical protein
MEATQVTTRFITLEDVVSAITELEARHAARRDRRGVFATVYALMSQEMKRRIEDGAFRDSDWVRRYTIAFANLYRAAHDDFESGRAVPKAWTIAFETARGGVALVTQDLLLGINAHINHDLALALDEVSIEPDRDARRADHSAVNEVLQALTEEVGHRVSDLYARGLAGVDACAGTLDEAVSNFSLAVARAGAWESAVALANARADIERRTIRRMLDLRSAAMARLILAPNLNPVLLAKCRLVEQSAWWELLSAVRAAAHPEARSR